MQICMISAPPVVKPAEEALAPACRGLGQRVLAQHGDEVCGGHEDQEQKYFVAAAGGTMRRFMENVSADVQPLDGVYLSTIWHRVVAGHRGERRSEHSRISGGRQS